MGMVRFRTDGLMVGVVVTDGLMVEMGMVGFGTDGVMG
jgi:hypothetical protein